jgi:hypothetical protein
MCSQIDAEPGPPLKAKVIGPARGVRDAVPRVGRVAEACNRLVLLLVLEDQPADGRGVLDDLAAEGDLVVRHLRLGHRRLFGLRLGLLRRGRLVGFRRFGGVGGTVEERQRQEAGQEGVLHGLTAWKWMAETI